MFQEFLVMGVIGVVVPRPADCPALGGILYPALLLLVLFFNFVHSARKCGVLHLGAGIFLKLSSFAWARPVTFHQA